MHFRWKNIIFRHLEVICVVALGVPSMRSLGDRIQGEAKDAGGVEKEL